MRTNITLCKGDMVIEYMGELVRRTLADLREKQYDAKVLQI